MGGWKIPQNQSTKEVRLNGGLHFCSILIKMAYYGYNKYILSKIWGSLNARRTYVQSMLLKYLLYFDEECTIVWKDNFFVKGFIQLTFSTSRFFLTWNRFVIILTFPKNIILYFHAAIFWTFIRLYVRSV